MFKALNQKYEDNFTINDSEMDTVSSTEDDSMEKIYERQLCEKRR